MSEDIYLVWSHEHSAWWAPSGLSYVRQLSQAARFTHARAMQICINAMPGARHLDDQLPELPVRLADVAAMRDAYHAKYPTIPEEGWE